LYFRSNAKNNFFEHPSHGCEFAQDAQNGNAPVSAARLQRELPTITVTFADGTRVTLDGVGSYLLPCNGDYQQWLPGLKKSNDFSAGWTFLNVSALRAAQRSSRPAADQRWPVVRPDSS
jgi:hypothetical protein